MVAWQKGLGSRQKQAEGSSRQKGSRQQAVGSGRREQGLGSRQKQAEGSSRQKGSRQQAEGSRQQAAGSKQQAEGSRQQAAGDRQQRADSRLVCSSQQEAGMVPPYCFHTQVCHPWKKHFI